PGKASTAGQYERTAASTRCASAQPPKFVRSPERMTRSAVASSTAIFAIGATAIWTSPKDTIFIPDSLPSAGKGVVVDGDCRVNAFAFRVVLALQKHQE